jgi:hypothetical protein
MGVELSSPNSFFAVSGLPLVLLIEDEFLLLADSEEVLAKEVSPLST